MIWRYQPDKWLISPISAKILVDMWDLDVFAGSGAGCRNLCSGLIFASSIESPKSPNASKFISFCESVELASEVLYVLCKYGEFFLCTAQTNVFFCIFDAKIRTSANLGS